METTSIPVNEPDAAVVIPDREQTNRAEPAVRRRRGRPRRDSAGADSDSKSGSGSTSAITGGNDNTATDNGLAEISQGDIKLVSLEDILGKEEKKEEKSSTVSKEEKRGRPVGWQAKATESVVDLFSIGAEWLNEPKFALNVEEEAKLSSNLRGFLNSLDIKIQKRIEIALEKQLPVVLLLITLGTIILPRLRLLGERKKVEKQSVSNTSTINNISGSKTTNPGELTNNFTGEIRHQISPIYFNK